jgi:RNA polymerase sigma-70 factor (ECF subfamily)
MSREKAQSDPVGDELKLVRRSQRGDSDAFAQLYDAYFDRIYRYVYFRVLADEVAEDISSQVFLKAWEKVGSYQPGQSPFIAWLYRIAHNAVIDHYRTSKIAIALDEARPVEISQEDGTDEKLDLQFASQQLREALKELTEEQQQVLILKFINGLSTPEIARQLGKQQGAVRALQMRALQGLAKSFGVSTEQVYEN